MPTFDDRSAVFVSGENAMEPEGGGVQRCTREYVALARAAGWKLTPVIYAIDRRPAVRLRRKLRPAPYRNLLPPEHVARVVAAVRETRARWIFLNQTEAGPFAPPLLQALATEGVKIALLSHGADSTDYLHTIRTRATDAGRAPTRTEARWLGQQLFAEMEHHRACDVVFCLSEVDREIARWLGAPRVHVLPRIVEPAPLDWQPVANRVGTVSTLVHAPNAEGILRLAEELDAARAGVRLRLVGSPRSAGEAMARRHPAIEYLGPLSDAEFAREASTWCAFVNPIFCVARGCSTKLAVPLSWHLPVVTTPAGARGYVWDEGLVPLLDTPAQVAAETIRLADLAAARAARERVQALARKSPTLADLAGQFSRQLDEVSRDDSTVGNDQ